MVIVALWAFFGLVYSAPIYSEVRAEGMALRGASLYVGILLWVAWAPLTPPMIWLARRFSLVVGSWKRTLPIHLPAFLILSSLHSAAAVAVVLNVKPFDDMGTSPLAFWPRFFSRMKGSFGADIFVYGAVVGVCYAIDYYRKYREHEFIASQLEAQLAQAQLDSLRMQLHPHFLFNTLNGIVGRLEQQERPQSICSSGGRPSASRAGTFRRQELIEEMRSIYSAVFEDPQMRFSDRLIPLRHRSTDETMV
jgi:hypothetical protein